MSLLGAGTVIGQPELLRLVGSGGMGMVYEARDVVLNRRVALKVVYPHLTESQASRDSLLREARLAASVEHPGIVPIYRVHEQDGVLAIEMQFVDGTPLNQLMSKAPFTPFQCADLMLQVLNALAACHAKGVVHGDLKPSNLLVTADGRVILTDFGVARTIGAAAAEVASRTTHTGAFWCTPQYCPPEAWEDALPTPGWDLYALGILVREALTAGPVFDTPTAGALVRQKLSHDLPSIHSLCPALSPGFAALIDSLSARDLKRRPPSANAAIDALRSTPEHRDEIEITQPFRHTVKRAESPSTAAFSRFVGLGNTTSHAAAPIAKNHRMKRAIVGFALAAIAMTGIVLTVMRPDKESPAIVAPSPDVKKIKDLYALNGTVYFSYDDGWRGRELWCAEPSGEAVIISDINPGPASSNPRRFLSRPEGNFLFAATTAESGEEPWYCSKGKEYFGVSQVVDVIPGPMSSEPIPVGAWKNLFMFYATTVQHGTELWLTTTHKAQTGMLQDMSPADGSSVYVTPNVCADQFGAYFVGTPDGQCRLFRYTYSDGTVKDIGPVDEKTGELILMGETLILELTDDQHGHELWMYRPGMSEPEMVADIWPGPESSCPKQFFVWRGVLYFQAMTKESGQELWIWNPADPSPVQLADIFTGPLDSSPYGFVATDKHLFFRARNAAHGQELWMTDGTTAGTRMVFDILPGPNSSNPYNIAPLGGLLFFTADDVAHGEELWAVDLERLEHPPFLVRDLIPGATGAEPHNLAPCTETTGIFAHKNLTGDGDSLMQITVEGSKVQLRPIPGLL